MKNPPVPTAKSTSPKASRIPLKTLADVTDPLFDALCARRLFASLQHLVFENMERAIRLLRVESDHFLNGSDAQKIMSFDVPLNEVTLRQLDEVGRQLGETREEIIQKAVMVALPAWEKDLAIDAARR